MRPLSDRFPMYGREANLSQGNESGTGERPEGSGDSPLGAARSELQVVRDCYGRIAPSAAALRPARSGDFGVLPTWVVLGGEHDCGRC